MAIFNFAADEAARLSNREDGVNETGLPEDHAGLRRPPMHCAVGDCPEPPEEEE